MASAYGLARICEHLDVPSRIFYGGVIGHQENQAFVNLLGIEIDTDLYRAALVNMRTFALGRPYLLLRANALVVDASLDSPNWRRYANLWNPPHWQEMKLIVGDA